MEVEEMEEMEEEEEEEERARGCRARRIAMPEIGFASASKPPLLGIRSTVRTRSS
jgi:hypothetical protein